VGARQLGFPELLLGWGVGIEPLPQLESKLLVLVPISEPHEVTIPCDLT
jgi:hypothetical protein